MQRLPATRKLLLPLACHAPPTPGSPSEAAQPSQYPALRPDRGPHRLNHLAPAQVGGLHGNTPIAALDDLRSLAERFLGRRAPGNRPGGRTTNPDDHTGSLGRGHRVATKPNSGTNGTIDHPTPTPLSDEPLRSADLGPTPPSVEPPSRDASGPTASRLGPLAASARRAAS